MSAGLTRRQWLKLTGAGSLLVLNGCADDGEACDVDDRPVDPAVVVATFDVGARRAVLWAGGLSAPEVRFVVEDLETCATVYRVTLLPGEPPDVASLGLAALAPSTRHRWRAETDDAVSRWAFFTTAPPEDEAAGVRFIFSADVGPDDSGEEYDVFGVLAGRAPAFYLSLGDWPYADKAPAATTLEEFRAKHRVARASAQVRDFLASVPVVAIYDDHDVKDNWDGELAAVEPELVAAGTRAWHEWFPLDGDRPYRKLSWGRLVDVFVLDTRSYRSADAAEDGPDKTMLGDDQLAWLERELARSTAAVRFIVTSVTFTIAWSADDWSGFPTARARLMDVLDRSAPARNILLSADRHFFAASRYANGLREVQVGPLAAGLGPLPDPLPAEVVATASTRNFGEVELRIEETRMALTIRCCDIFGETIYEEQSLVLPVA